MLKNHKLAKAISDEGWSLLFSALERKSSVYGCHAHKIGRWEPTTKTCSRCGKKKDLRLSDRTYSCDSCGLSLDRDRGAARNVLKTGLEALGRATAKVTSVETAALPFLNMRNGKKCLRNRKLKSQDLAPNPPAVKLVV